MVLSAQLKHALRDENGWHVIVRGFVVVTNNSYFDSDDYIRMVRLGANYQVVRLEPGRLSSIPGASLEEEYLIKLDSLVQLGKDVGIITVFKMTLYDIQNFVWEDFWLNKNKLHEKHLEALQVVWKRYANEIAAAGYDLVNEPRKLEMEISYEDLSNKYLLALYCATIL